MQAFGKQLSNTLVMLQDGTQLGEVYNVVGDLENGTLKGLLFEMTSESNVDERQMPFEEVEEGVFKVPASNVEAIKDYIIVSA